MGIFVLLLTTTVSLPTLQTCCISANAVATHGTLAKTVVIIASKSYTGNTNYTSLTGANSSEISDDVATMNNLQSRNELLNNISSYDDLHKILAGFRNFLQMPVSISSTTMNNISSHVTEAISLPTGSIHVYYASKPEQLHDKRYLILMLKFTNRLGQLATKRVDYNIMINKGTNHALQKNGTTFNGADIRLIDENTFPKGSEPHYYAVQINITNFNDNVVNEHTKLLRLLA